MTPDTTTRPSRRPAGPDRPTGDEFWDGYQPRAAPPPLEELTDHGRALTGVRLAAHYLAGLPPVSHPRWCDPARCEVLARGTIYHRRLVGRVVQPPTPGLRTGGLVIEVTLERFDNIDDGEWAPDPDRREVVVATEHYDTEPDAGQQLAELSAGAAGRLGALLASAARQTARTTHRVAQASPR